MGAFEWGNYKSGMKVPAIHQERLGYAFLALKKELTYNGFGKNLIMNPVFGEAATNRTKEFQESVGLTPDGTIGRITARELFRKRVQEIEQDYGLPHGTLGKKFLLESAYDPVAIGFVDPDDTGIAQINLRIHTGVSLEQAFDPEFSFGWAAEYVKDNRDRIIREVNVLKAARAAYNIGVEYAKRWMLDGFPASGGPLIGGADSYERATQYIALIDKQNW